MIPVADKSRSFADGNEAAEQRARPQGLRAFAPLISAALNRNRDGEVAGHAPCAHAGRGCRAQHPRGRRPSLVIGPKPEGAAMLQTGCESSDQDDRI